MGISVNKYYVQGLAQLMHLCTKCQISVVLNIGASVRKSAFTFHLLFFFLFLSTICKGVFIRKWSLHSQKENKSSKKNAGTSLPATFVIWRKSPRKSFTGKFMNILVYLNMFHLYCHWMSSGLLRLILWAFLFQTLTEQIATMTICYALLMI